MDETSTCTIPYAQLVLLRANLIFRAIFIREHGILLEFSIVREFGCTQQLEVKEVEDDHFQRVTFALDHDRLTPS